MNQPNPWVLFTGGISLFYVAMIVNGLKAPIWLRYPAAGLLVAGAIAAMVLGVQRTFMKKPERPKFVPKKKRRELDRK